jgi:excisionase family DNA binding protein
MRPDPTSSHASTPAERPSPERLPFGPAAEFLGISPRHLRRLVQDRRIAHAKIGGRLVFDERDLEELLERGRREAIRAPEAQIPVAIPTHGKRPGDDRGVEQVSSEATHHACSAE